MFLDYCHQEDHAKKTMEIEKCIRKRSIRRVRLANKILNLDAPLPL
jgi:hypothetical protein